MRLRTIVITSLALPLSFSAARAQGAQQTKALRFAAVVDGSGRVIRNGVVIVNADTVVRVLDASAPIPAGAEVVDLRKFTAIPGMIDVHTHVTYAYDPESGNDP